MDEIFVILASKEIVIMNDKSDGDLTNDVVKEVVSMLCGMISSGSLAINTTIATIDHEDAEVS